MRIEKPCEGEEGSAVLTADTGAGNFMKAYDGHTVIESLRREGERGDDVNMTTITAT